MYNSKFYEEIMAIEDDHLRDVRMAFWADQYGTLDSLNEHGEDAIEECMRENPFNPKASLEYWQDFLEMSEGDLDGWAYEMIEYHIWRLEKLV